MTTTENEAGAESVRTRLSKRLDDIGWALFFVMTGGLWLAPNDAVPRGAWLIGAGLIMLGVNGARSANGLRVNRATLVLGVLAVLGGLGDRLTFRWSLFPVLLILIGLAILLRPRR